jgi:hypothetical protein
MAQTSTEYGGLGQSGYTAGRHAHDHALERELEATYVAYPQLDADEDEMAQRELATDDRFTGRGGPLVADDREAAR